MAAHRKSQRVGCRGKHARKRQPGDLFESTPRTRGWVGKRRITNPQKTATAGIAYPSAA